MKHLTSILLLSVLLFACDNEEYSNIPSAQVSYTLYPKDVNDLAGIPSSITVTKVRNETDKIGYGGLLVVHGTQGDYFAFDLSCPVEARRDKRIEVASSNVLAVCPSCGAEFNIETKDGFAVKGSRYNLTGYDVYITGTSGLVKNKY